MVQPIKLSDIGMAFLEGGLYDTPQDAINFIEKLRITDVNIDGNKVVITLSHPGMLIGPYGKTFHMLENYLSKIAGEKVVLSIIELKEHVVDHITYALRTSIYEQEIDNRSSKYECYPDD